MTKRQTSALVLALVILSGCAPSRLYFKPASFASPVPPGMVVEEIILLSEGAPESLLKVAAIGLYKRQAEGDAKKPTLHLRFTFLNNQPRPLSFYPGEVSVVARGAAELRPTLIEKTRRLAPGGPAASAPTKGMMPRPEAVPIPPHSLVQFDLFFDLREGFKYEKLENFVTYFKFTAFKTAEAVPLVESVAFTRLREVRHPGYYYEPARVRVGFGFSYTD